MRKCYGRLHQNHYEAEDGERSIMDVINMDMVKVLPCH